MDEDLQDLLDSVSVAGGEARMEHGQFVVICEPGELLRIIKHLRDNPNCRFCCFTDICGVDYPERERRFEVVYHLLSPYQNARVRVKVSTDEAASLPSIAGIFPAAVWYEREIFDLYGVSFTDHPDLRRILTDYDFSGHPLRKDFPLVGHMEIRYDDQAKRVVYEPVQLMQDYRDFDYLSPWEGAEGGAGAVNGETSGESQSRTGES